MSYILDALKRSEQERHQGELTHASIDTIMIPKRQSKHQWWPYVIIVLLLVNVSAYLYFQFQDPVADNTDEIQNELLVQSNQTPAISAVVSQEEKTEAPKSQTVLQNSAPPFPLNSQQPETERSDSSQFKALPEHVLNTPEFTRRYENEDSSYETEIDEDESPELTAEGLEIIRPKNVLDSPTQLNVDAQADVQPQEVLNPVKKVDVIKPQTIKLTPPVTSAQTSARKVDNFDSVRPLSDMELSFQKSIPDIRFNSHIFASNPEDRRVMINDLYLREKQSFSGLAIETIGEFFIVLEKDGQTFKIPVLRDWYSPK